jgi:hypothetical protein
MATKKKVDAESVDQETEQVTEQVTETIAYKTAAKHSAMFDILIGGEVIAGQWGDNREYILFSVPARLAEGLEKHWHFTSGNVVKVA